MSVPDKPANKLLDQIKELKKKLSFMEVMRGEKFDSNELDLIKLKLELEKSRRASSIIEIRHNLIYSQPYLGIVYFDDERTVVDCNDKFSEIVGYSKDLLVGHNIFNVFEDKEILLSIQKSITELSSKFEGKYLSPDKKTSLFI
ncbi:MAG: PAS domain-containing protein, partial [Melioribacteraceae bacterium]|nr:PAS domain-containing protein [Melioribacteraceae bacterium]